MKTVCLFIIIFQCIVFYKQLENIYFKGRASVDWDRTSTLAFTDLLPKCLHMYG